MHIVHVENKNDIVRASTRTNTMLLKKRVETIPYKKRLNACHVMNVRELDTT